MHEIPGPEVGTCDAAPAVVCQDLHPGEAFAPINGSWCRPKLTHLDVKAYDNTTCVAKYCERGPLEQFHVALLGSDYM